MPDIQVRGDTTLYGVLRGGRHVLVVPAAHAASVLGDAGLRPYRSDLDIVTPAPPDPGTGPVVLVRPDGHVAARGRPGRMAAVTGYLRDLFREPLGRFTLDAVGCEETEGVHAEAEGARAVPGP